MPKSQPVDIVPKLVKLLQPLDSVGRRRAIQAALTLMGETSIDLPGDDAGGPGSGGGVGSAGAAHRGGGHMPVQAYFQAKDPKGKVEELAVAARYREEHGNATASSKADIQKAITDARRNFDASNYNRDMANAKRKGFFTIGGSGRDQSTLSHYGQRYVDALPDRAIARKVPGAKRRGAAKKRKGKK